MVQSKLQQEDNKKEEKEGNNNDKIIDIENNLKNLENKINNYEFDQLIENIAILKEKQNETKIYEAITNLESQLSEVKEKLNKQGRDSNRNSFSKNKSTINETEIMNKINNQENTISSLKSQIKKIQEEKNNINDVEKALSDIIQTVNDLNTKLESLFTITKKLSSENNELNIKTNNILSTISKINTKVSNINSKPFIQENNILSRPNYHRNFDNQVQVQTNQNLYHNKTTPNLNSSPHNNINSAIVSFDDIIFLINRLKEMSPKLHNISFNLVYRASQDGDKAADFHRKCDKIGPNLVLIKTRKGNVFGGFTFKNWEHMPRDIDDQRPNLGSASRDSRAFGFNVNSQKIYNNEKPNEFAIWCNKNYGPTFKNNLFQIFDSCLKKGGYCSVRNNSHFGGQLHDYEIAGGESRFRVEELEVFEIKNNK